MSHRLLFGGTALLALVLFGPIMFFYVVEENPEAKVTTFSEGRERTDPMLWSAAICANTGGTELLVKFHRNTDYPEATLLPDPKIPEGWVCGMYQSPWPVAGVDKELLIVEDPPKDFAGLLVCPDMVPSRDDGVGVHQTMCTALTRQSNRQGDLHYELYFLAEDPEREGPQPPIVRIKCHDVRERERAAAQAAQAMTGDTPSERDLKDQDNEPDESSVP